MSVAIISRMKRISAVDHVLKALYVSSLASVLLYVISTHYYGAGPFWFLNWNLVLAWLPLGLVLLLKRYIKSNPWASWRGGILTTLWLIFLPNSFYLISDFIHLGFAGHGQTFYYVIMLFSYSFTGLMLGFTSVYILHQELLNRLKYNSAHTCIALVLLICSFAVYLGRYLRWNTWDIVLHPVGVVFDVSDRVINPVAHGQTFQVTAMFFILLSSTYFTLWHLAQAVRQNKLP